MTSPPRDRTRIEIRATDWDDPAGVALREAMQAEMDNRYADRLAELVVGPADTRRLHGTLGIEVEQVAYVGIACADRVPVGHVALRRLGDDLELKRMYVVPPRRGSGIATALLRTAEDAARSLGASRIILQTGDRQPDAVGLYEREGYSRIPVFSPYEWLSFSICMEKLLCHSFPAAPTGGRP
ncbi:GNAT family N-acetyltransferase [Actinomadura sp. 6N118]|uniref:GNAT family N-acetyltransferase n=1 Tax=Actinomadura sp. 6N118 TaxID=3375151 RepID=UPI0037A0B979